MITAERISVKLGRAQVLNEANLEATAGGVVAIIGPNGSGKTTFVRALTGEVAYQGRVTLNGHDIAALKPWQLAASRAVLPQATSLSFPFNVAEIVSLGITSGVARLDRDGRAERVDRALQRVDLSGFEHRFYQELSGGEKQRVQLARVLCQIWEPVAHGEPRWLFLDEPVSSLDIRHQLMIMRIARDYADRGGGVVAIMHDLNLTAMFADRVCLMRAGTVAAFGTPVDVIADGPLSDAFDCDLRVGAVPGNERPFVLPHTASM